jgi:predicted MFS family arabinose efflux permease
VNFAHRVLLLTTAIQVATAAAALALPAVAPLVAADLGLPASLVGSYVSLLYVGAASTALASGGLMRRQGPLRLSQWALALAALGLVFGVAANLPLLVLAALVIGLGYGPITPASSEMLARTADPRRLGLVFSIKQTGVPAGAALAGLLMPPLALLAGWRLAALAMAAVCLIVAWAAQPLRAALDAGRDPQARQGPGGPRTALAVVLRTPGLRTLAAVSFVYAAMQMCVASFMVAYLVAEPGLALVTAGLGLTVASVAGVVGRIAWGALADRWQRPRALLAALGGLMALSSLAAAAIAPSWPLAAVLSVCAALGATAIGWNGVYLAEVARVAHPGEAGLATGGCLFFTFAGVVAGPHLFGVVERASGSYAVSFVAAAVVCGATGAALALSGRPRGRD